MIVILKPTTTAEEINGIVQKIETQNLTVTPVRDKNNRGLVILGQVTEEKVTFMENIPQVDIIEKIEQPYPHVSRQVHPADSVIEVGNIKIGGGNFGMIGGPCSIESYHQLEETAEAIKAAGGNGLRGGAFKPRTSPYSFQGLGKEGLDMMHKVGKKLDMPIVSEVMAISQIPLFEDVDLFQVGARNMQNFDLLKELGKTNKPILLKRGLSSTIKEWLMSAEYIMAQGNSQVILCERGIRTFETATRNTQDLSAIGVVKQLSHLPVVIDPSHAAGRRDLIESLSLAAVAAGADGLIIEAHRNPEEAVSDGAQSLYPDQYAQLTDKVWKLHNFMQTL